jgi:hypothetical protein
MEQISNAGETPTFACFKSSEQTDPTYTETGQKSRGNRKKIRAGAWTTNRENRGGKPPNIDWSSTQPLIRTSTSEVPATAGWLGTFFTPACIPEFFLWIRSMTTRAPIIPCSSWASRPPCSTPGLGMLQQGTGGSLIHYPRICRWLKNTVRNIPPPIRSITDYTCDNSTVVSISKATSLDAAAPPCPVHSSSFCGRCLFSRCLL